MPSPWPRRFCCDEDLALIGYDGRYAAKELASWQRHGPRRSTRELIDVIRAEGVQGAAVRDVGAGVGAVHTALLEAGAASAVDVDASREYLATARAAAEQRGLAGRVGYRYGDVVELAADLPPADIVTLDAVICCYPYLPALLEAALTSGPRLVGLVYPRDVWWMLAFMRLFNIAHSLLRSPARYFIHRQRRVRALMAEAGYAEVHNGGSPGWRVVLYRSVEGRFVEMSEAVPRGGLQHRLGVLFHRLVAIADDPTDDDIRLRGSATWRRWCVGTRSEHRHPVSRGRKRPRRVP